MSFDQAREWVRRRGWAAPPTMEGVFRRRRWSESREISRRFAVGIAPAFLIRRDFFSLEHSVRAESALAELG